MSRHARRRTGRAEEALTADAAPKTEAVASDAGVGSDATGQPAEAWTAPDETGMTTSEYAVGTVGACSIAAILYQLAQSDWFTGRLQGIFEGIAGVLPF
jgi:Protein of unknown function (DUF4244)